MLNKIGIGTANFMQNYGILSHGKTMESTEVDSILKLAIGNGINTFDTAFAYGDFFSLINDQLPNLKIITKFSILDNYDVIYQKMKLFFRLKRKHTLIFIIAIFQDVINYIK